MEPAAAFIRGRVGGRYNDSSGRARRPTSRGVIGLLTPSATARTRLEVFGIRGRRAASVKSGALTVEGVGRRVG